MRTGKVKVSANDFTTPVNKRKEAANKPKKAALCWAYRTAPKHTHKPDGLCQKKGWAHGQTENLFKKCGDSHRYRVGAAGGGYVFPGVHRRAHRGRGYGPVSADLHALQPVHHGGHRGCFGSCHPIGSRGIGPPAARPGKRSSGPGDGACLSLWFRCRGGAAGTGLACRPLLVGGYTGSALAGTAGAQSALHGSGLGGPGLFLRPTQGRSQCGQSDF